MKVKINQKVPGGVLAIVAILALGLIVFVAQSALNTTAQIGNESKQKVESTRSNAVPAVNDTEPKVPAEYKSAINKAKWYANSMHMSKQGVYDQLVSEYGEKFTAEAAQYAIDNLTADWNANALVKAKFYQDTMSMSPAAVHDQLTSAYGEKFTQPEADYAIQHLND